MVQNPASEANNIGMKGSWVGESVTRFAAKSRFDKRLDFQGGHLSTSGEEGYSGRVGCCTSRLRHDGGLDHLMRGGLVVEGVGVVFVGVVLKCSLRLRWDEDDRSII